MALARRKKILYATLTSLVLLLALEVALRVIYFQIKADSPSAVQSAILSWQAQREQAAAEDVVERFRDTREPTWRALYSEKGEELRAEFMSRYTEHFAKLVQACQAIDSQLLVLYIPSTDVTTKDHASEPICKEFFRRLSEENDVPLIDVSASLRDEPWERVTLSPDDDHLSREGNRLVAARLAEYLIPYGEHRCQTSYSGTPAICGDLPPGMLQPWHTTDKLPFVVQTNAQGFRSGRDVEIPKKRQRVLVLGDSYTFGVHLPNEHTFPGILQQRLPDVEILNAGIVGYTIVQQAELFVERAVAVAPDITILQVLDNDIYGMFFFTRSWFDRQGRRYQASAAEREFLDNLGLAELADW